MRLARSPQTQFLLILLAVVALAALGISRVAADDPPKEGAEAMEGGYRFLAHVSTDKPIYKPGEEVRVRAVVLHALTRRPHPGPAYAMIEVLSPRGDKVARGSAQVENGSLGWSWPIEPTVAGGDYIAKVTFPNQGIPPSERKFSIRAFRERRFRTQIEFGREGYAPGDEVTALLSVTRSEGGIPVGAPVTVVARVDQQEVYRGSATVDAEGYASAVFTLPAVIAFGDGTLVFSIEDGGVVETADKTIPILVSVVDLRAYPEGGELVRGVENRVYFEAIAPNGRPADVGVELLDSTGRVVCSAKSEHEGRGRFAFTPDSASTYTLRVVEPWTVRAEAALPPAKGLALLRSAEEIFNAGDPIEVEVAASRSASSPGTSSSPASFRIVCSQRDVELAGSELTIAADDRGFHPVRLVIPDTVSGVLRVTVLDTSRAGIPIAERLVFRRPAKNLSVEVALDKAAYVPADAVIVKVTTRDENGKPVPAVVGLTVTDDATLEMVETREQAPRLPAMVYIEPEVRELADAWIYLSDDPEAPRAIDLLLGTQGWRRFAYFDADAFKKQHGDAALRVLAEKGNPVNVYYAGFGGDAMFGVRGRRMDKAAGQENERWFVGAEVLAFDAAPPPHGLGEGKPDMVGMPVGGEVNWDERMVERIPNVAPPEKKKVDDDKDVAGQRRVAAGVAELAPPAAPAGVAKVNRAGRPMRQEAQAGVFFMDMSLVESAEGLGNIIPLRVFAHPVRADRQPDDRVDFTQTVYWNAGIATDTQGEAEVLFHLSDSVTSFRVLADGYAADGRIAVADAVVESRRPFYAEVKTPLELTAGDKVNLPLVLVNETDNALDATLALSASGDVTLGEFSPTVALPAHSRKRVIVPLAVNAPAEKTEIILSASAGSYSDNVTRSVPIKPLGFPVSKAFGGVLEGEASHDITIPASITDGGITATAAVYPSPLANLTAALESLIRDPNGCFEQTSSTNYPLVMAMQYFETHQGVDPELVRKSREKLDAGYKRLVGFECKEKGYEWFGGDPGHEALTAYGLLEFTDMAAVQPVDAKMMERTRGWLLARRDGKGGFNRNERALDSFGGAPPEITNAYIVWALAVAGEKDIVKELDAVRDAAMKCEDPYQIALVAGALIRGDRAAEAAPLLKRLVSYQTKDGVVEGAKTTITRSGGSSLLIETTSLAVLAWLADPAYAANVEMGMKWLCSECEGGRFGATQSTVLALKAIIEYDKARSKPTAAGAVILMVDGKAVEELPFQKGRKEALEFKAFGNLLLPGKHTVTLKMKDGSPMPYSVSVDYHAETPSDAATCPLELTTRLAETTVKEGEPIEVVARIRNTTKDGQPMTMVLVGLPAGLEPRIERLREQAKEGVFDFYEVMGRDVALYFRDLAPEADQEIVVSCIAAVPGEYTGAASRAYLYYTPEEKRWNDGLRVVVEAK